MNTLVDVADARPLEAEHSTPSSSASASAQWIVSASREDMGGVIDALTFIADYKSGATTRNLRARRRHRRRQHRHRRSQRRRPARRRGSHMVYRRGRRRDVRLRLRVRTCQGEGVHFHWHVQPVGHQGNGRSKQFDSNVFRPQPMVRSSQCPTRPLTSPSSTLCSPSVRPHTPSFSAAVKQRPPK